MRKGKRNADDVSKSGHLPCGVCIDNELVRLELRDSHQPRLLDPALCAQLAYPRPHSLQILRNACMCYISTTRRAARILAEFSPSTVSTIHKVDAPLERSLLRAWAARREGENGFKAATVHNGREEGVRYAWQCTISSARTTSAARLALLAMMSGMLRYDLTDKQHIVTEVGYWYY